MSKPFTLPSVAFFGRTYEEYLEMFSLKEADLRGASILDCPSGPAAFIARAAELGARAVGCDPMYSLAPDELAVRAKSNIDDAFAALDSTTVQFHFRDPAKFVADKYEALESFLVDYRAGRGVRYVPASLPHLPFADRSFDLVLSSNFLFCYASVANGGILAADTFDLNFHLCSVTELARVAARELRLVPTHGMQQPPRPHPFLAAARARLESLEFTVTLEPSEYDDGFDPLVHVLVARR
ncbi:MAG: hypothetical protein JNK53_01745 [Phycisphaerae bacterium]|nr:hypothetical protein [Phycisphaerae bacterium]